MSVLAAIALKDSGPSVTDWIVAICAFVGTVATIVLVLVTIHFYRQLVENDTWRTKQERDKFVADEIAKEIGWLKHRPPRLRKGLRRLLDRFPDRIEDILIVYERESQGSTLLEPPLMMLLRMHEMGDKRWPTPAAWEERRKSLRL